MELSMTPQTSAFPHFQNFLGVVFGDQIPWISKRKITEDQVLIDSQPCILF
jgi:hypothetical protein